MQVKIDIVHIKTTREYDMRKLFFMLLLAAITTFSSHALIVNNTAGQLAEKVNNNLNITTLVVNGTLDARDFLFITNSLNELTSLDLSQATIVPLSSGVTLYGTVTDYVANEIPRTAFFGKKLTTVKLPLNLESIGYAAFAGCKQLTSITLPSTLCYIGDYAFSGSGLTSIELPMAVQVMGKGVFSRCESMTSAVINSKSIGDFAFLGDYRLNNVSVGANVNYILRGAFNGCTALTTVTFDPTCRINRIDEEAFINSGLANIDITTLGLGTIGDWAMAQTQLTSIQLPNGMTHLGEGAFSHNQQLSYVTLPGAPKDGTTRRAAPGPRQTIDHISDFAFAGDGQLHTGSVLRNGVTHIGNFAFYNNSQDIDTMWLPSTIVYLGDRAMAGMIGMTTLRTDAYDVPELGNEVWAGVDQPSVPLIAPDAESTNMYRQADQWMNFFFQNDDFILGDVNNDGFVTIADVTTLIDYLLNSSGDINLQAADVTHDGDISIADVTALIDMLLNGNAKKSLQRIRALAGERCLTTSDALSFEAISLTAGGTCTVDVALNNDEHEYTAMQCEIVLPQGVKLVSVEGINRGEGHGYYARQHEIEENIYTLMGISMGLQNFEGNEGNIVRLTLAADDDFDAQEAEMTLTNVLLVTPKHLVYLAGDAMGAMNNTSGVEQVTVNKEIAAVRYINVAGQESDRPFDGINIVVTTYTDGTSSTVKVIK